MTRTRAVREVMLVLGLIAFGMIVLPALIYLVGQQLVGEYLGGITGLYAAIGDALLAGSGYAWTLILSPYLGVQLVRFWFSLGRSRQNVS